MNDLTQPVRHGGNLDEARRQWPDAPKPWIDLSTGINPWPWPVPELPAETRTALPSPERLAALEATAARAYGVPDAAFVVALPGTQAAIQWLPHFVPRGAVAVLGPTYAEHVRGWALAGHRPVEAESVDEIEAAQSAVIVNPNNPTGRLFAPEHLIAMAADKAARGGVLVVDEAFADVTPGHSVAGAAGAPGLIVLRSFGKFFGLAGIRLGFVLAPAEFSGRLRQAAGPWAVSGEAIAIGSAALADSAWHDATRRHLTGAAAALDADLERAGLTVLGGTDLFRLAAVHDAPARATRLAEAGLWVRRFDHDPAWLRFGLPPDETAAQRLRAVL